MADPNTRQGKRTPVTLKIKFKSETLEQFIERYAVDVSQGGIFIRTKEPLAVGTQMKFEFQLRDASPLISGEGTVVWTRENDPSRPAIAPGMGVRFDRLNEGSQQVLERILSEKAKQAPQRGGEPATKPPMFTDTPTKVAPMPVQEALGVTSGRTRRDSEQTPLPKPVPFHSDADEFDENAFQEATKVRSLEELAAASAKDADGDTATTQLPQDELAARRGRADMPLADAPAPYDHRDSAPGLPPAPEQSRPGRLLDTSPSPRSEKISSPPGGESARTKLGMEPNRAVVGNRVIEPTEKVSMPRAVPLHTEDSDSEPLDARRRPSIAPIVIGILFVVVAALAGVYWFVVRPALEDEEAANKPVKTGSASGSVIATGSATGSGSAVTPTTGSGSAVAMTGSNTGAGSATGSGSAAVPVVPAVTVDTVIASSVAKATVTIEGIDTSGPVPFTAKLEKDKPYKARVEAPGFVTKEIDVKGGDAKVTVKLDPKIRTVTVTSEPAGAQIYVDGGATGKVTPADVALTPAQAAKPKVHVTVRKGGYRPVDQVMDATSWKEDDAGLSAKMDAKLVVMPVVQSGGTKPPNGGAGSGSGSGSGSAGAGSGSGSGSGSGETPANAGSAADTPKPPPPPPPPAGSGSSEPEPDWSKKP